MTAADVRVPRARLIVIGAAVAACAVVLWLSRAYTFYFDEWSFITQAPDATFTWIFRPHNEHPAVLFRVVYAALLDTAGLRTYVPYMAVLVALHLANVLLVFELVRRRSGDLVAMCAAALLLVLGAGWEDFLWAFQMAWLASTALGLGMLIALLRSRVAVAAALLTLSLAFSGIGAVFAIAAAAWLGLEPNRRRLFWLAPVAVLVLAWYAFFGHTGNHPNPPPTAANVLLLPAYVSWGVAQSAGGVIGIGGAGAWAVLLAALCVLAWTRWRRGTDAFTVSVAVALIGFYVVTGMSRAQLGWQQSGSSRYLYIGSTLWILLLSDAARLVPWRGTWRPAALACVFLACFNSAVLLVSFAVAKNVVMERQVADYYALAAMRQDPCLDPNGAVDPLVMPVETSPAVYYGAIDAYGDPIDGMPLLDRASYDTGMRNLRKAGC